MSQCPVCKQGSGKPASLRSCRSSGSCMESTQMVPAHESPSTWGIPRGAARPGESITGSRGWGEMHLPGLRLQWFEVELVLCWPFWGWMTAFSPKPHLIHKNSNVCIFPEKKKRDNSKWAVKLNLHMYYLWYAVHFTMSFAFWMHLHLFCMHFAKPWALGFMGDSRDLKRQFCPSTLCQDAAHVV